MIICSCNVFSDQQVCSALAKATQRLRVSQIYDCLGGSAQCGQCAHTIKRIMEQVANRAFVLFSREHEPANENARTRHPGRQHPASVHTDSTSEPIGQRLNVIINNTVSDAFGTRA
jgi:bacterioferritin-associated ferredoxin